MHHRTVNRNYLLHQSLSNEAPSQTAAQYCWHLPDLLNQTEIHAWREERWCQKYGSHRQTFMYSGPLMCAAEHTRETSVQISLLHIRLGVSSQQLLAFISMFQMYLNVVYILNWFVDFLNIQQHNSRSLVYTLIFFNYSNYFFDYRGRFNQTYIFYGLFYMFSSVILHRFLL